VYGRHAAIAARPMNASAVYCSPSGGVPGPDAVTIETDEPTVNTVAG